MTAQKSSLLYEALRHWGEGTESCRRSQGKEARLPFLTPVPPTEAPIPHSPGHWGSRRPGSHTYIPSCLSTGVLSSMSPPFKAFSKYIGILCDLPGLCLPLAISLAKESMGSQACILSHPHLLGDNISWGTTR